MSNKNSSQTTHQIPMMDFRASVAPNSYDAEKRTVELVWTTGAQVRRGGFWSEPYIEELEVSSVAIRMDRLNGGAPLLNSHSQYDLRDVIGVVEKAWIDGKEGRAIVRFSEREEVQGIVKDVQSGVIRNVSVGYRTHKLQEITPPATEKDPKPMRTFRAVDWEPMELSLVPIGADPKAGVRSNESTSDCEIIFSARSAEQPQGGIMDTIEQPNKGAAPVAAAPVAAPVKPDAEAIRAAEKAAANAERARVTEIQRSCEGVKLSKEFADKLVNDGVEISDARKLIIDEASRLAPAAARTAQVMVGGLDETVTVREGIAEALMHRANPGVVKLTEKGRGFRGLSLIEHARMSLERSGVKTSGMSKDEVASRSLHSTSDFPAILQDITNKTLRGGYEASQRTFQPWCRQASASDFKTISRAQLSEFPNLLAVNESGEFKRGMMSDGKETYALATYGRIIGITRKVIINDDLDAFARVPASIGESVAALESDLVYAILTGNPNLADSVALFATAATRKNLAASGAAISVTTLGAGKSAMRSQKNLQGRPINIVPSFLIVPTTIETVADQYTSSQFVPNQSNTINPFAKPENRLSVIVEPRLDVASATAWYLAGKPGMCDTIEYCYLDGQEGVYTETRMGFDVDGMEIKARHDFAAKAIDFRALYKNPGA